MEEKQKPIGFFDSGVGGLSVLRQALKVLPNENYIFYGDDKNAPYGTKTEEEIKSLSMKCGEFLFNKGVKVILVACNTATSVSIREMRSNFNIPVLSMEPAVKPALAALEKGGKVLVMATPATISQSRYLSLLKRLDCEDKVINMKCAGLVEIIEKGELDSIELKEYLDKKLSMLKGQRIDAIVMGCTHYSFVSEHIRKIALKYIDGKGEIFDGMYGVVNYLKRTLEEKGLVNEKGGNVELFSSESGREDIYKKLLYK